MISRRIIGGAERRHQMSSEPLGFSDSGADFRGGSRELQVCLLRVSSLPPWLCPAWRRTQQALI